MEFDAIADAMVDRTSAPHRHYENQRTLETVTAKRATSKVWRARRPAHVSLRGIELQARSWIRSLA